MFEHTSSIRTWSCAILLIVACCRETAGQTAAQPPESEAVLAVVDAFMNAISTNDFAAMAKLRVEGGSIVVERPAPGGGTLVTRRVFTPDTS